MIIDNPRGYHRTLMKKEYKDFVKFLKNKFVHCKSNTTKELYYCYIHDINSQPVCKNCQVKETNFRVTTNGYNDFCSQSCNSEYRLNNSKKVQNIANQSEIAPVCDHSDCDKSVTKNKDQSWSTHCSIQCRNRHNSLKSREKSKQTMMKNWGVEHAYQSEEIQKKIKNQFLKKYGCENPAQNDHIKNKIKSTNLAKYGVENPAQSTQVKDKIKATNLLRWGVENVSQSPIVHQRKMDSGYQTKEYIFPSGRRALVQGYENLAIDLLLNFYNEEDIIIDTDLIPAIPYNFNHKGRIYFPDIFVQSKNTIYEVKSDYTFLADLEINRAKQTGCELAGYNFEFLVFDQTGNLLTEFELI